MALASLEDFTARHGEPDDAGRVQALLNDASTLILAEVSGSELAWVTDAVLLASDDEDDHPDDPTPAPKVVRMVCVSAAYRAWRNPDALERKTLGARSETFRGKAEDALYLTEAEKSIIGAAATRSTFRSATLATPFSGDERLELPDLPL